MASRLEDINNQLVVLTTILVGEKTGSEKNADAKIVPGRESLSSSSSSSTSSMAIGENHRRKFGNGPGELEQRPRSCLGDKESSLTGEICVHKEIALNKHEEESAIITEHDDSKAAVQSEGKLA